MLDLKFIRENFALVEAGLRKKNAKIDLAPFTALDEKRREILKTAEELKALRNRVSEEIGQAKKKGGDAAAKIAEMKDVTTWRWGRVFVWMLAVGALLKLGLPG